MCVVPSDPILVTERLVLRALSPDDLDALNAIQSDPHHMRFYPHPFSPQETAAWIDRRRSETTEHGYTLWAVIDRATKEFLGNVGPTSKRIDGLEEVELGWSITPARARQGIASEAAAACRDWCWEHLAVDYLISLVRPENEPSRGVAERIGMSVWKETIYGDDGWTHLVYRVERPTAWRTTLRYRSARS